jgi:hypothetical protein
MDPGGRFTTPTTRRAIVRTGAKLAYAAPLVAASLKLSATHAAAAISHPSTCGPACEAQGDCFCATPDQNGPDGAKICVSTTCGILNYFNSVTGCIEGSVLMTTHEPYKQFCAMPCGAPCPDCKIGGQPCDDGAECCNNCCSVGTCCT